MISRYVMSFNFAALITFGLFFAMQLLIAGGETVFVDKKYERVIIDITPREPLPPETKIRQPERQPIEEMPKTTITAPPIDGPGIVGPTTTIGTATTEGPVIDKSTNIFMTEGGLISILRPAPQYPGSMAEKGIEGFVRLQFAVNKMGKTENIVVVSSSHRGFEGAAVKAAEKFMYKPEIRDGEPIDVPIVYSTIEFKLEG